MLTLGWPAGALRVALKPGAVFQGHIELRTQAGTPQPWPTPMTAWLRWHWPGSGFDTTWPATISGSVMSWAVPGEDVSAVPLRARAELWLDYADSDPILWLEGERVCNGSGFGFRHVVPAPGTGAVAVPVPGPPGPPGPGGGGGGVQAMAAHSLGGHRLVVPRDSGEVEYADCTDPDHVNRPVWLTTAAWPAGALVNLVAFGEVEEGSWAWTPGAPLLVGANGLPVHTLPSGAVFSRRVAEPVTPTTIWFDPAQPIAL